MERATGARMSSDLPWSPVFDAKANLRALSSVQADGFRAASELVDRFVRIAAAGLNGNAASEPPPRDEPADLYGATGLEPFVTSWWAMVDQFLRITSPRREQQTETDTATLDFAASHSTGRLQLSTVAPGAATAELWLHNRGPIDMGKVVLRCGDLLSHQGNLIAARLMRFEPDIVPMPARSSRGVTVEADIDEHVVPGSYRGMLVADGHPDVWLPIELVVKPLLP
ncbi:hypothetical protein MCNS_04760 [Mycobacterium conspicuum]|uniref:Uncharacterized protein n=2 Tax=Mycobacterium conspicuum TaxID=44010 RepID=A0A7I7Y8K5_9MYCO|nr:hypothetical protein MCNS_04760 [Mycobacterium conspicuum]